MAIAKNNIISWHEIVNYLLPAGVSDNYINKRVDNSGKASSIPWYYQPNQHYVAGRVRTWVGNSYTDEWTMATTDASGKVIYASVAQVDLAAVIQNYLHLNGYRDRPYTLITTDSLIKLQSMIVAFIQNNVHKFYALVNPSGASYYSNTKNSCTNWYRRREFWANTTYTPINTNPGINVPTVDPNHLSERKNSLIIYNDIEDARKIIQGYLDSVSTLTIRVTNYCHSSCWCHHCCCSCSCGGGRWL